MNQKYDFGIVIGRFQPFHLAHQKLIEHSLSLAEKVIVILGSARSAPDVKNPFTPAMREEIIRACFPQEEKRLIFRAVRDYPYNDHVWTAEIQNIVGEIVEDSELGNLQIPLAFEKYADFKRGEQGLTSPDKKNFPVYKSLEDLTRSIRPANKQTSDDRIKILTFGLTKKVADDAQNNVLLIRDFVNENWAKTSGAQLLEPTLRLGTVNFRTTRGRLWTLDLTSENSKPNQAEFEAKIKDLLAHEHAKIAIVGFFKDKSSYYLNLFPQWSFEEFYISDRKLLSSNATVIREKYFTDDETWRELVPETVQRYLEVFKTTEYFPHLQDEFAYINKYKQDTRFVGVPFAPVFLTTDAVVVQSGHVLVVRRRVHPGKGLLALPGGFLAADQTLEDSMIRELKEETQIKVPAQVLRGSIKSSHVFDYPERSQRGRTVTFAYYIELAPDLKEGLPRVKGGDDAAKAFWLPLSALGEKEEEFFEDHVHIVKYFLGL